MKAISIRRAFAAPTVALLALGGTALVMVGTGTPAGATTTVHDATELQTAFNSDETVIILANNISVTSSITRDVAHSGDVIVDGGGFTVTSDGSDRIFTDNGSGKLTLQNITLTGGSTGSDGGAVFAQGDVTASSATFSNNDAGDGGAIWADGNVTADAATFTSNVASNSGGAIGASGDVTVKNNSQFTGNTAESDGGAVYGDSDTSLLDISGSTFTNNQADSNIGGYGDGGAAMSFGRMIVAGSTFTGNFTTGHQNFGGGAVEAIGTLTISDSQFANNSANYVGGAVYGADNTTIARSTFTGNCAQYGGAIEHNIGSGDQIDAPEQGTADLSIVNATVTANTQSQGDSAIGAFGATTEVAYSTIVGNINDGTATCGLPIGGASTDKGAQPSQTRARAQVGSEVGANIALAGAVTLFGNVIAQPVGGANCIDDGGTVTSQGYNFSDDTSCGLTDTTDKVATPNDPQLNPLAANGGVGTTMLPFTPLHGGTTSPLIDAIPAAACQTGIATGVTTDERGVTRPQLVGCDIGAVEVTGAEFQVAAQEVVLAPKFTG